MAADSDYVDFVLDCMAGVGPVRPVRFFSGTGLVMDGVQFAMITKSSRLFLVVDDETRPRYQAAGMEPFWYTRKTGRREVHRWYELPEDVLMDSDELRRWVADAIRIAAAGKRPKRAARTKQAPESKKAGSKKAVTKQVAAKKPALQKTGVKKTTVKKAAFKRKQGAK